MVQEHNKPPSTAFAAIYPFSYNPEVPTESWAATAKTRQYHLQARQVNQLAQLQLLGGHNQDQRAYHSAHWRANLHQVRQHRVKSKQYKNSNDVARMCCASADNDYLDHCIHYLLDARHHLLKDYSEHLDGQSTTNSIWSKRYQQHLVKAVPAASGQSTTSSIWSNRYQQHLVKGTTGSIWSDRYQQHVVKGTTGSIW